MISKVEYSMYKDNVDSSREVYKKEFYEYILISDEAHIKKECKEISKKYKCFCEAIMYTEYNNDLDINVICTYNNGKKVLD